jgi:hypothetical protein
MLVFIQHYDLIVLLRAAHQRWQHTRFDITPGHAEPQKD